MGKQLRNEKASVGFVGRLDLGGLVNSGALELMGSDLVWVRLVEVSLGRTIGPTQVPASRVLMTPMGSESLLVRRVNPRLGRPVWLTQNSVNLLS